MQGRRQREGAGEGNLTQAALKVGWRGWVQVKIEDVRVACALRVLRAHVLPWEVVRWIWG
jgi:hypothetical protein